jgi:hypothetical protein
VQRRVVTAAIVVAVLALFTWEWAAAPRVEIDPEVRAALRGERGELYLGETFEGLPLRSVDPFVYSDCKPGRPHPIPCTRVVVREGRVSGTAPEQVARARRELRRVA